MAHLDTQAENITTRLEQLSPKYGEKKQPKGKINTALALTVCLSMVVGAGLGSAGTMIAAHAVEPRTEFKLSDEALNWIVYEVSENRDISPNLARQILQRELGTKTGAH